MYKLVEIFAKKYDSFIHKTMGGKKKSKNLFPVKKLFFKWLHHTKISFFVCVDSEP